MTAADNLNWLLGRLCETVPGIRQAVVVSSDGLALAKSEGELSLILRSYADTGGPSGRVSAGPRQSSAVPVDWPTRFRITILAPVRETDSSSITIQKTR